MRAFLVLGPESSGTRLMTRLLMAAGCDGDDGQVQRWDTQLPVGDPVVWRRSVPYAGKWPDIDACIFHLYGCSYDVSVLVMSREWHAMEQSQIVAGHVPNVETAHRNIRRAYCEIFGALAGSDIECEVVNYETLIRPGGEAVIRLMKRFRLTIDRPLGIYDGNAKYSEERH